MPSDPALTGDYVSLASLRGTWREGMLMLMYHAIEPPPLRYRLRYLYVDPRKLRAQIRELQAEGVRFVSLDEWHHKPSSERQVVLTFDDGFQNLATRALPVLRELGVPAITYLVAGQLGGSNAWDRGKGLQERPLMSRAQIGEWLAAGLEIGAHTMTHPALAQIDPHTARREIVDSKKVLEDLAGRQVRHFCYPYGSWNAQVRDLVMEAGFETACIVRSGYNLPETDAFALWRFCARHRWPRAAALAGALRG
jgi:peptidoglycan/xylan/chitin deacetylase (PgdA/CDA1 family)